MYAFIGCLVIFFNMYFIFLTDSGTKLNAEPLSDIVVARESMCVPSLAVLEVNNNVKIAEGFDLVLLQGRNVPLHIFHQGVYVCGDQHLMQ